MKKLYEESYIQDIADTIRSQGQLEDEMAIAEMPYYIRQIKKHNFVECDIPLSDSTQISPSAWVRPTEWEDISGLDCSTETEVVYLSLYNSGEAPWALGLYITAPKGTQVEYGHVVNNEFVPNGAPELIASNTGYVKALPENETTLVAKITNQNYLYPITYFNYYNISAAIGNTPIVSPYYYQPVVERIGKLPYVTSLSNSGTTRGYSSCVMERDALRVGEYANLTSLANAWQHSWKLKVLDLEDLDTSHWKVTSLSNTWNNCYLLESLDLNDWDTSLWKVTNLSNTWYNCLVLKNLQIGEWDTTEWAVTTIAGAWQNCKRLVSLDISKWNTTNWKVTTLASAWSGCWLLEELDLSKWNTTNWAVTTLGSAWSNCQSLKQLDLNSWNTTNWAVATMSSVFEHCHMLNELLIDKWNTSNWKVNTLSGLFGNCWNIVDIDLSAWNVSNWGPVTNMAMFSSNRKLQKVNLTGWDALDINITLTTSTQAFINFGTESWSLKEVIIPGLDLSKSTRPSFLSSLFNNCYSLEKVDLSNWKLNAATNTMANMFTNCYNLRELDLSTWDLTGTAVTTLSGTWQNCRSLKSLNISTWDVSNWVVTTLASAWSNCYSLQSLDVSQWDVSKWRPTTMASIFTYNYSLEECPITNWDMSQWSTLTTVAMAFQYCRNLKEIDIRLPENANITTYQYFADGCDKLQKLSVGNAKHTGTNYPLAPTGTTYTLTDFYPVTSSINQSYSTLYNLSRESLLRILNKLPVTSVARTVTLGNSRSRLRVEDIAIATEKGWNVA